MPSRVLDQGLLRGRRFPQSLQPDLRPRSPIFLFHHAVDLRGEPAASVSGYPPSEQGGEDRALTYVGRCSTFFTTFWRWQTPQDVDLIKSALLRRSLKIRVSGVQSPPWPP